MKIAIVHDFLLYPGGAEKVLFDIMKMFPKAPVYTLLYDKERMEKYFKNREVRTSFLQKWPKWMRKKHRWLLPFFGTAIESFDFRDFDLIVSSSGAWSKGIVTRLNTKHVAYVHSPMRYIWDENEYYMRKQIGRKNRFCVRTLFSYLRVWDHQAAQRPDVLVANSKYTKKRISKYYRRDSEVIYPGAESSLEEIAAKKSESYFLVISRLSKYKNVNLAIEACNKLQLPLVVVGDGQEKEQLKKIAGETVKVVGYVSEAEKQSYLKNARALLFPSEDDFGIVCVEAIREGVPVIALDKGGASEIVTAGKTGELFDAPTVEMMADAMRRFLEKENQYNHDLIKRESERFAYEKFRSQLNDVIERVL